MVRNKKAVSLVDVYALAAGHGACTLVFVNDGKSTFSLMIDCGTQIIAKGYRSRIARIVERAIELLERDSASRLDVLVASHSDTDHIGGINSFLTAFSKRGGTVGHVLFNRDREPGRNKVKGPQQFFDRIVELKAEQGFATDFARTARLHRAPACTINIVAPDHTEITQQGGGLDANILSAVIHIVNGETSLIVCGDAYAERINQLPSTVGKVDVVLAPHHGARIGEESETRSAYSLLKPQFVVCSAGDPTQLCDTHFDAVHASGSALMCTGASRKCDINEEDCAGEVWIRLAHRKPVMLATAQENHRDKVTQYPSRRCIRINPDQGGPKSRAHVTARGL
ncbi:MAG: MBL fold metallo-hydrolase [Polyangiaceae bacterium]